MTDTRRLDLVIWGESLRFEGFRRAELDELFDWFAGSIDIGEHHTPTLTVRMVRSPARAPAGLRSMARHRGGFSGKKYFLDGTPFDQDVQTRDISIVSESPGLCCYAVDDTLLVTSREQALVLGMEPPPMLLADLVENWVLWRAREAGVVMVHGSGWIRDGGVEMLVGHSGAGKTTELLRQMMAGAEFFSNDRVALRLGHGALMARNFPQPVNVGCGTIRALGLDLPTFGLGDRSKIRLMPPAVLERWQPSYERWHPVRAIHTPSWEALDENVHWDGDADHPFWNGALRPRVLSERPDLQRAMQALVTTGWQPPAVTAEVVGGST